MHERYSHPTIIFIACYAILSNRYLIYSLISVAYFLNLEFCLNFQPFADYNSILYNKLFISILYLIAIVLIYKDLFNVNFKKLK